MWQISQCGTPVITHRVCHDAWLAHFSLIKMHKGGLKRHHLYFAAIHNSLTIVKIRHYMYVINREHTTIISEYVYLPNTTRRIYVYHQYAIYYREISQTEPVLSERQCTTPLVMSSDVTSWHVTGLHHNNEVLFTQITRKVISDKLHIFSTFRQTITDGILLWH